MSSSSPKKFSQTEKVAILLLSLGEDLASELIQKLPRAEAERVLRTMGQMRSVDADTIARVQGEFQTLLQTFKPTLVSGPDMAKRVLAKAFTGEDAAKIIEGLPRSTPQSFQDAEHVDAKALWQILGKEHPQTVALILAHLSPKKSGDIASQMPPEIRVDVLARLASLRDVEPSVLDDIDDVLAKAIDKARHMATQRVGGPRRAAEILTHLGASERQTLLTNIESRSPELAAEVRAGMFTFDDLVKLDKQAFEKLLKVIPTQDLATALRRCDERISILFFGAMSSRRAEQFKEDMAAAKPVSISKIDEAQRKIASLAAGMIASGEIRDPLDEAV